MSAREAHIYREQLKAIARALDAAAHGQAGAVATTYALQLGCSVPTLYRKLEKEGIWTSGRKARSDKGKTALSDKTLEMVAALQKTGFRKNGKQVMHTPLAVSIAAQTGFDVNVSAGRVQRVLKDRGLDAAMQQVGSAPVAMSYDRINEVHQFDWSVCLLFLSPTGRIEEIREDVAYKNKPEELTKHKLKVLRGVVHDMASGWTFVQYVAALGENQRDSARVLVEAWRKKPNCVFHGLPEILYVDKGIDRALGLQNLMAGLEVKMIGHAAGNARATGGVEGHQNIWETHFEALLKIDPVDGFDDPIAALNARALDFCNKWNAGLVPHLDSLLRRPGLEKRTARTDLFLLGLADIRLLPDLAIVWAMMAGRTKTRKVPTSRVITYRHPAAPKVREYDLTGYRELRATEQVTVRPLLFGLEEEVEISVERYDGEKLVFRVQPIFDYNRLGFRMDGPRVGQSFKQAPDTLVEQAGKRLDQLAYGVDADGVFRSDDEIQKAKANAKVKPFAHMNAGEGLKPFDAIAHVEMPTYLDRPGVVFTPKVVAVTPPTSTASEEAGHSLAVPDVMQVAFVRLDHFQMAKGLKRMLGDSWTPDKYALLVEWYPSGCMEEELPLVMERLTKMSRLRLVD